MLGCIGAGVGGRPANGREPPFDNAVVRVRRRQAAALSLAEGMGSPRPGRTRAQLTGYLDRPLTGPALGAARSECQAGPASQTSTDCEVPSPLPTAC